jgi:hypothetical protein
VTVSYKYATEPPSRINEGKFLIVERILACEIDL